jgi:hypothetical protein
MSTCGECEHIRSCPDYIKWAKEERPECPARTNEREMLKALEDLKAYFSSIQSCKRCANCVAIASAGQAKINKAIQKSKKAKLKKCKKGLEEIADGKYMNNEMEAGTCDCPGKARELLKDLEGE